MQNENDTSKHEDLPQEEAGEGCSGATCSSEIATRGMWKVVSATFHADHATMGHYAGPFPSLEVAQAWIDLQPNKDALILARKTISHLVFEANA